MLYGNDQLRIIVTPPSGVPNITSANSTTATQGKVNTFQVTATGNATITYELLGEPAGVTIDQSSGLITIAATTAVGTYTFTIKASNLTFQSGVTQPFTLTVNSGTGPGNFGPVPNTGLPDITLYTYLMFFFGGVSIILWGYLLYTGKFLGKKRGA